jgi:hypothetical protein
VGWVLRLTPSTTKTQLLPSYVVKFDRNRREGPYAYIRESAVVDVRSSVGEASRRAIKRDGGGPLRLVPRMLTAAPGGGRLLSFHNEPKPTATLKIVPQPFAQSLAFFAAF